MINDIAVRLEGVSKKYTLYHEKPTLVESILIRAKKEEFWALKDINLVIKKGERVGIIGPNGSGKTTLLKIMSGITTPTAGKVETHGKIVSLIELGAGFNPELTGEENIYLNGMLIGMSKSEIIRKKDEIIRFSGVGNFIDTPFYMYSQGMKLRLGFSILIHSNPDTILLDESMSVGDQVFQSKARKKFLEFLREGKTIIVVSHDFSFLRQYTKRILWFDRGEIRKEGDKKVIDDYWRHFH